MFKFYLSLIFFQLISFSFDGKVGFLHVLLSPSTYSLLRLANDLGMSLGIPFFLLTPLFSVILCAGSTEKSVPLFLRRGHANLLCIVPILVYVLPLSEHVYSNNQAENIYGTNGQC